MTPLNVLIGPNGSGKSNLIEAIELLHATPTAFAAAIRDGGGAAEWLWKGEPGGSKKEATIEAVVHGASGKLPGRAIPDLRYRLEFRAVGARTEVTDEAIERTSGDRGSTKSAFLNARVQEPTTVSILLVDSETAVASLPRAHLKTRDEWDLDGVPEEHVHLMAQVMETWFVADPENVKAYYGKDFNEGALPKHAQPESVSKAAVAVGLENATKNTKKGPYHKIKHGSDLLARIGPDKVKQKCPHCRRLFDNVEALLA